MTTLGGVDVGTIFDENSVELRVKYRFYMSLTPSSSSPPPAPNKKPIWFVVALAVAAGVWWFGLGSSTPESTQTRTKTVHEKDAKPHFKSRSATDAPLPPENETTRPNQDTVELVYPDGILLNCPASGLEDGPYRVSGFDWQHVRVEKKHLVGVLTTPSEGSGFVATLRGHLVAEFQWTDEYCRVNPLSPMVIPGLVLDDEGDPMANVDVVGCAGDLMTTKEDGSFELKILSGQHCYIFAYRDDDDGFAKGAMVEVVGGETERVELQTPGPSMSAEQQRQRLAQGAHQLLGMLEQRYAAESPVTGALKEHPDNPVLRAWSDDEVEELNLRYDDVEYLLSGDANEEDWRDVWLFGFGS